MGTKASLDALVRAEGDDDLDREHGVSRRRLLRNALMAGAAAWTAPVIIDSVSSSAFAVVGSGCVGNKYYVKLCGRHTGATGYSPGDCYYASPLCNGDTSPLTNNNSPGGNQQNCSNGYTWVCTGGEDHVGPFPGFVDSNSSSFSLGTYTVTLSSGCTFSGTTQYNAVGNYNWSGFGGTCLGTVAGAVTVGTNTAVFKKSLVISGTTYILDYMYLEFVCS